MMPTPASSRHSRTLSPPLSSSSSQAFTNTISQQQKLNVVTRLAIEGHAKKDQEGASIKVYLKMSLPLDSVTPGSTIPLFPEENVKILKSQVHPIDVNSLPYNFSSANSPLLHNAARALNLPARSSQSYLSLFGLSTPYASVRSSVSRSSPTTNGTEVPPLDDKYTGHILVSGYHVSYVLPREFPSRSSTMDDDDAMHRRPTMSAYKSRRSSIGEKNTIQFMAAVDMWVPYVSQPPRAPWLITIPIPRCLSNHIKLRIFPPKSTAASFASLSSAEEDAGSWDLTSDPHVTRTAARPSRAGSYTQFADDESSDSSVTAGFANGYGIQGTFPSAERIRVRWASPVKTLDMVDGGGRRRVGVRETKGEMACAVLGREQGGMVMRVEYKGTCKGVWFPGVATMLGMDVGLEAKGSDVAWVQGYEQKWTVSGGSGYTGFDVGAPPQVISRQPSLDSPPVYILPSSPDMKAGSGIPTRQNSTSSTSSLLRAPLPVQNVPEYSFEGSQTSSGLSETISSLGSVQPSSPNDDGLSRQPSLNGIADTPRPPAAPITVHINMNDLLPPAKNVFTFTITGTVLITPRPRALHARQSPPPNSQSDNEADPEPLVLPRFSVLAAAEEATTLLVRNETDSATVEVFSASGDLRDAQTRRTVLQRGGMTRCGADGGRIALRTRTRREEAARPPSRPRTPNGNAISRVSSASSLRPGYSMLSARPKRDGPLMIPYVVATVTPLLAEDYTTPNTYAVRICLPAPSDVDSEWLEFGLAQPGPSASTASLDKSAGPPRVDIVSTSVDGVPVKFETIAAAKDEQGLGELGVPFEEMSGKEWVSWVRVRVGDAGGGDVVIDYVVKPRENQKRKGKARSKDGLEMEIFLPTFALPVGRLEVNIEAASDFEISSLRSNLAHQQTLSTSRRLLHFSLAEYFYPHLSMHLHATPPLPSTSYFSSAVRVMAIVAPTFLSLILLFCLLSLGAEFRLLKRSLDNCGNVVGSGWDEEPVTSTVTMTTTVLGSGQSKWWFGETGTTSVGQATKPVSTHIPSFTPFPSPPPLSHSTRTLPADSPSPTPPDSTYEPLKSLLPINRFPFSWPLRFDFALPPRVRATMKLVMGNFNKVWKAFRKVYHYPLDPP